MGPESVRKSSSRVWWLLIGGLIVFSVVFTWLEDLVRNDSPRDATAGKRVASSPAPPEVRLLEDGGIEIRHDFFRRTTIRLQDEEKRREVFDCLTAEIERRFGDGTAGWNRGRVQRETEEARFECLDWVPDPTRLGDAPR